MPCYHPLKAWRGNVLPSGKRSVVFKQSQADSRCAVLPQKLPCGQCFGCRLDYSLDWATRCMMESSLHEHNCFITLTHDENSLPKSGSLDVKNWQTFIRDLRYRVKLPVRYFHAGEYGELYGRPHYHALLFGYDFPEKKFLKTTSSGSKIYTSELLKDVWNKGHCSIGDLTFESAAYVARYCMKKVTGKGKDVVDARGLKHYERLDEKTGVVTDLKPEYVTMSRRPGIARGWYDKYKSDVYPHDYVVVRDGVKMPPPRYFDGLYELTDPGDLKRIKLTRAQRCTKFVSRWSDELAKEVLDDDSDAYRLAVKEKVKVSQMSQINRKLESELL